jgi:uncharacterized membrane protein YqjE
MEKAPFADNISEVIDVSRKYIDAHIDLIKLTLLEKISKVVSLIISSTLILLVASICLLFVSLSAAIFIGHRLNCLEAGFMIIAGFYFVLIIVFWQLRDKLVINPVVRRLKDILFPDNETEEDEA